MREGAAAGAEAGRARARGQGQVSGEGEGGPGDAEKHPHVAQEAGAVGKNGARAARGGRHDPVHRARQ